MVAIPIIITLLPKHDLILFFRRASPAKMTTSLQRTRTTLSQKMLPECLDYRPDFTLFRLFCGVLSELRKRSKTRIFGTAQVTDQNVQVKYLGSVSV